MFSLMLQVLGVMTAAVAFLAGVVRLRRDIHQGEPKSRPEPEAVVQVRNIILNNPQSLGFGRPGLVGTAGFVGGVTGVALLEAATSGPDVAGLDADALSASSDLADGLPDWLSL